MDNSFGFRDWVSRLKYPNSPSINQIKKFSNGKVTYVKSHAGVKGNEIVDEFARRRLGVSLTKV